MSTRAWPFLTLFLIVLSLAVYLLVVLRSTVDEPRRDVSIAGYVAIGCATASAVALAAAALLLHRRRRR